MESLALDDSLQILIAECKPPTSILQSFDNIYDTELNASINIPSQVSRRLASFQLLTCAVYHNHIGLLRRLLGAGCCVNLTDVYSPMSTTSMSVLYPRNLPSPLHTAILTRQASLVDMLLEAGSDPFEERLTGSGEFRTAFDDVCAMDDTSLLLKLRHLYDTSRDRHKRSILHVACQQAAFHIMEAILSDADESDVNAKDAQSYTPLLHAVCHGYKFTKLLLERGADPNASVSEGNALHLLLQVKTGPRFHGQNLHAVVDTLGALLGHGCHVDERTPYGLTPLTFLCTWGNIHGICNVVVPDMIGSDYEDVTLLTLNKLLNHSKEDVRTHHGPGMITVLLTNISELLRYLGSSHQGLIRDDVTVSINVTHLIMKKLLEQGIQVNSAPDLYLPDRSPGLISYTDLTALETIMDILASCSRRSSDILNLDMFEYIGNKLLVICCDLYNYGATVRVDVLGEILSSFHSMTLPFVEQNLMRRSQKGYQEAMTHLIYCRRDTDQSVRDMISDRLPRVPPLKHVSRLRVYEAMCKDITNDRCSLLGLPQSFIPYMEFHFRLTPCG